MAYSSFRMILARSALSCGAFKFSPEKPFTWASGAVMPVYNDNRLLLRQPRDRRLIAACFTDMLLLLAYKPDHVTGVATGGVPHAALLADSLTLPLSYVRQGGPKDHGLKKRVEGIDSYTGKNRKVVVVEDLISTGKSAIEAVKAVREAGGECGLVLSVFTYGFSEAEKAFSSLNPPCEAKSIFDWDFLLQTARETGVIEEKEEKALAEWREAPFKWAKRHGFQS